MRFVPTDANFLAQGYSLIEYWLLSPILAGSLATCSGSRFLRFQPDALETRAERHVNFLIFGSPHLDGLQPPGVTGDDFVLFDLVDS